VDLDNRFINSCLLNSSSGRNSFEIILKSSSISTRGEELVCCDIVISGIFWSRIEAAEGMDSDLVPDYSVHLHQVILLKDRIDHLIANLDKWLKFSESFFLEIADGNDQSLTFFLGDDSGLICSGDKPACVIKYVGTSFRGGEWAFVVDTSCIEVFNEGLRDMLSRL